MTHNYSLNEIGLDLGGDTPESIAVSIVSEIQAALNHRNGGMLRDSEGQIHTPPLEVDAPYGAVHMEYERPAYCETSA